MANAWSESRLPKPYGLATEIHARFRELWLRDRLVEPRWVALGDGVGYSLGEHSEYEYEYEYRKPDASVVLMSRLPAGWLSAPVFQFAPDLAVEVVSPTDSQWQVERKVEEYLAAGSRLVWVARPAMRRISAYLPDGTEKSFGPNDQIDAAPVLPGLRFRVGDVFPPAELRT